MNDGGVLLESIKAAYLAGQREYIIPRGDYLFVGNTPSFRLIGFEGLTIYASGAQFIFEPRVSIAAVNIVDSNNIQIHDLTVDYNPLPFSQGTISLINKNANYIEVDIDAGYPIPTIEWSDISGGNTKAIVFTDNDLIAANRMDWIKYIENISANKIRCYLRQKFLLHTPNANVGVGSRIALPDRKFRQTLVLKNSHSNVISGWHVHSSPQMVFVEVDGDGNNVYSYNTIHRINDRLLTSNADVFHSINVGKGPTIINNYAECPGDDFANVHSHSVLVARNGKETICFCNSLLFGKTNLVNIYNQQLTAKGSATILYSERVTDTFEIEDALKNVAHLKLHQNYERWNVYKITTDVDLSIGDILDSDIVNPTGTQISNNRFQNGFSRGILLKSNESRIENNYINRTGGAAIHVGFDRFWLEGGFPKNIVIVDNVCRDSHVLLNTPPQPASITIAHLAGTKYTRVNNVTLLNNAVLNPRFQPLYQA